MPVEVVLAVQDTVADAIVATGQIEAVQAIELKPDVEGRIVGILVREGAVVAQATPLFKVDDEELKTQVAQLEAEHDLAQQALRRTRDLLAENASSPADLERAEATARSARAQLEAARLRLERSVVRAPFAGAVGARSVSIGDYVTRSSSLVTLQTIDPQRAVFDVPERYAPRLAVGQQVNLRVAAVEGRSFSGTVDFVDPRVALPGRTITVKARVPNPDRVLKAGMFIEARLVAELRPNAILVAEDAILPLEGATYVWVAKDGAAQRRQVQLGVRIPGWVEVKSGVEAGEPVVVAGGERLNEGQPVAPTVLERTPS
jgi:membrane fusion protein (multidrug efflux system)